MCAFTLRAIEDAFAGPYRHLRDQTLGPRQRTLAEQRHFQCGADETTVTGSRRRPPAADAPEQALAFEAVEPNKLDPLVLLDGVRWVMTVIVMGGGGVRGRGGRQETSAHAELDTHTFCERFRQVINRVFIFSVSFPVVPDFEPCLTALCYVLGGLGRLVRTVLPDLVSMVPGGRSLSSLSSRPLRLIFCWSGHAMVPC